MGTETNDNFTELYNTLKEDSDYASALPASVDEFRSALQDKKIGEQFLSTLREDSEYAKVLPDKYDDFIGGLSQTKEPEKPLISPQTPYGIGQVTLDGATRFGQIPESHTGQSAMLMPQPILESSVRKTLINNANLYGMTNPNAEKNLDVFFNTLKAKGYTDNQLETAKANLQAEVGQIRIPLKTKKQYADELAADNGIGAVSSAAGGADQEFIKSVSGLSKAYGVITQKLSKELGSEIPEGENWGTNLGKWMDEKATEIFPDNPKYRNGLLTGTIPSTMGGLLAFAYGGELGSVMRGGKAVGLTEKALTGATKTSAIIGDRVIPHLAPMLMAGANTASNEYTRSFQMTKDANLMSAENFVQQYGGETPETKAKALTNYENLKGKDAEDMAWDTFKWNMASGVPFAIAPVASLQKFDKITGGGIQRGLKIGVQGGLDGLIQFGTMTAYENLNAQQTYDKTRSILEGVKESGGSGFVMNAIMAGMFPVLSGLAKKGKDYTKSLDLLNQYKSEYKDIDEFTLLQQRAQSIREARIGNRAPTINVPAQESLFSEAPPTTERKAAAPETPPLAAPAPPQPAELPFHEKPVNAIPEGTTVEYNGKAGTMTKNPETGEVVFKDFNGNEEIVTGGGDSTPTAQKGIALAQGTYKDKRGEFFVRRSADGYSVFKINADGSHTEMYKNDKGNVERKDAIVRKAIGVSQDHVEIVKLQAQRDKLQAEAQKMQGTPVQAVLDAKVKELDQQANAIHEKIADEHSITSHTEAQVTQLEEKKSQLETQMDHLSPDAQEVVAGEIAKVDEQIGEVQSQGVPDEVAPLDNTEDVKKFADKIVSGSDVSSLEDQQFYDNNKAAIEEELQGRAKTTTDKPAEAVSEKPAEAPQSEFVSREERVDAALNSTGVKEFEAGEKETQPAGKAGQYWTVLKKTPEGYEQLRVNEQRDKGAKKLTAMERLTPVKKFKTLREAIEDVYDRGVADGTIKPKPRVAPAEQTTVKVLSTEEYNKKLEEEGKASKPAKVKYTPEQIAQYDQMAKEMEAAGGGNQDFLRKLARGDHDKLPHTPESFREHMFEPTMERLRQESIKTKDDYTPDSFDELLDTGRKTKVSSFIPQEWKDRSIAAINEGHKLVREGKLTVEEFKNYVFQSFFDLHRFGAIKAREARKDFDPHTMMIRTKIANDSLNTAEWYIKRAREMDADNVSPEITDLELQHAKLSGQQEALELQKTKDGWTPEDQQLYENVNAELFEVGNKLQEAKQAGATERTDAAVPRTDLAPSREEIGDGTPASPEPAKAEPEAVKEEKKQAAKKSADKVVETAKKKVSKKKAGGEKPAAEIAEQKPMAEYRKRVLDQLDYIISKLPADVQAHIEKALSTKNAKDRDSEILSARTKQPALDRIPFNGDDLAKKGIEITNDGSIILETDNGQIKFPLDRLVDIRIQLEKEFPKSDNVTTSVNVRNSGLRSESAESTAAMLLPFYDTHEGAKKALEDAKENVETAKKLVAHWKKEGKNAQLEAAVRMLDAHQHVLRMIKEDVDNPKRIEQANKDRANQLRYAAIHSNKALDTFLKNGLTGKRISQDRNLDKEDIWSLYEYFGKNPDEVKTFTEDEIINMLDAKKIIEQFGGDLDKYVDNLKKQRDAHNQYADIQKGNSRKAVSTRNQYRSMADNVEAEINRVRRSNSKIRDLVEAKKGTTVQSNMIAPAPFAAEFFQHDVKPRAIEAAKAIGETIVRMYRTLFPKSGVPVPALDAMTGMLGSRERERTKLDAEFRKMEKAFDLMPMQQQIDFIDAMKTGDRQRTPELQELAKRLRELDEAMYEQIREYKPSMPWLENHFRVLWSTIPGSKGQDSESIANVIRSIMGRKPLRGDRGFMKKATLLDMSEGIALGGVPATYNPIRMFKLAQADAMKYVTAQRMWDELGDLGYRKFVHKGKDAPEGYEKIKDSIAKVFYQYEGKDGGNAIVESGEWYVESNTARILNNYLSRDFVREARLGKGLLGLKNLSTMIELSLSAFHFTAVTLESMSAQFQLGLQKSVNGLMAGDFYRAGNGLKDIGSFLAAPISTFRMGGKIKDYITEHDFKNTVAGQKFLKKYPEAERMIDDLFNAGGTVNAHPDLQHHIWKALIDNYKKGNMFGVAIRALPAFSEFIMHPLFNSYIPKMKLGIFLQNYSHELIQNEARIASGVVTRGEVARKTWDFVEDRLGEMNFDHLFWDRTVKSTAQLFLRSVTWKLGNLRGMGLAVPEQMSEIYKAAQEKRMPVLEQKVAWLFGLMATQATLASVIQYSATGQYPQSMKDLIAPRLSLTDDNARVTIPTYIKDMIHLGHDPKGYFKSSLAGMWGKMVEIYQNKDFYNYEIHDPNDPWLKRREEDIKHLAPVPFSVTGAVQMYKDEENSGEALMSFMGLTPTPGWMRHTDLENEIMDRYRTRNEGSKPFDEKQVHDTKGEIIQLLLKGEKEEAHKKAALAVHNGTITKAQKDYLFRNIRKNTDAVSIMFHRLPYEDRKYFISKMTPEEQKKFDPDRRLMKRIKSQNQRQAAFGATDEED